MTLILHPTLARRLYCSLYCSLYCPLYCSLYCILYCPLSHSLSRSVITHHPWYSRSIITDHPRGSHSVITTYRTFVPNQTHAVTVLYHPTLTSMINSHSQSSHVIITRSIITQHSWAIATRAFSYSEGLVATFVSATSFAVPTAGCIEYKERHEKPLESH
jgi:hypothetical protein